MLALFDPLNYSRSTNKTRRVASLQLPRSLNHYVTKSPLP
ncbi:hypothetical protein Hsw_0772 [Hymenobacter swuensis DY53]|uniref:Uncharacterized protein n=1 Tax=Hymenobacter swuensis DY53 TaxID=1227739 RepID=W8EX62_9BACT|nr:hypothetical protein Hsw_0772 [Hymenobacter swuensis DY53]